MSQTKSSLSFSAPHEIPLAVYLRGYFLNQKLERKKTKTKKTKLYGTNYRQADFMSPFHYEIIFILLRIILFNVFEFILYFGQKLFQKLYH